MPNEPSNDHFQKIGARLNEEGGDLFKWEWDDRFQATLTTLQSTDLERVLKLLDDAFDEHWTADINHPPAVKEIIPGCGGLNANQHLYTSDTIQPEVLVAMVWPWNDGKTISLRVRLVLSGDVETPVDMRKMMFGWMGIDL